MKLKIYSTLLLSLFVFAAQAQTLVNRDWSQVTGYPNVDYDFQTSCKDGSNNLYTIGNSLNIGEAENFLITKYSAEGLILWQQEYNGVSNRADFGTDIVCFGNYLYVTGVSYDTAQGVSSMTTLKLNAGNGNILWSKSYRGTYNGYNFATAICNDNAGNVFVAGTSQTAANDYAMVTLKYNPSGVLQWTNVYDSVGLYDGAGAIRYMNTGGDERIITYGASGSATSSWAFETINIKDSSGVTMTKGRFNNANALFAKATDIIKDASDNFCATGTVATGANNSDIKVVKMSALFGTIWTKVIDGGAGKNDEATAMKMDSKGNFIITGYATRADNTREAWLLKLDPSGNTLWDRRRPSTVAGKDAQGKEVDVDKNGNIYITGKVHNGSNFDFLTQAYDSSGTLKWEKIYTTDTTTDDEAQDISVDTLGGVTVSGRNKVGANWRYTTVKYAQWYHPLTFTTGVNGSPISVENRILVKFNKDILNQTLLNNRDLAYINPNQLLTTVAYNRLKNAVPFDLVNSKIIRLSTLTPSDTFSISRSGVKIKIPPIWASFAIDYPNLATKNEANVSRSLDTLFPMIIYSHPDYVGKLDNDANDSYYNSSTIKQLSLFPNDYYLNPSEDTTQININEAWDYELGSQNIKIGVIDGFISHENIDLDLKGGYDYILKSPLINTQNPFNANSIHGTAVAGIIGAKRNNFINIAGIAGGEYNPQSGSAKPGVSIYGYRISSNNSPSTLIVSNAFSAITEHLYNTPSYQHDYMNLMNNSWGVNQGEIPNYQIDLLEEAVHQANRDQVTFVASRGNSPSQEDIHYPGIFYDNWVLSVGASGIDGKLADSLNTCNDPFNSSYGKGMDIIAPGAICKIVTLNGMSDNNTPPAYGYFSQTSAAAPHASGVAALLLSHYHGLVNSSDLAPEDIEYVLQVSSKDRYTKGYDDKSGWGFLDAGAAFRLANKTHHHFEHICNNADSNQITIKVDSANLNKIVYLSRKVQQDSSLCGNNIWFNKGNYKVDRFIIQSKYTLSPNGKDRVKGVWGLHSQSNTYYSDSTLNEILPFEQIKCCDTSKTGINTVLVKAFGYIYRVKDSLTGNTIGWLPFDTTCAKLKAKLCIGVLYEDTLHPPVVNSIQRIVISDDEMKIYPNPSDERITIEIKSSNELETSIDLYDVTGKLIKRIFNGLMKEGINKYTYSIEDLSNGSYYLKLTNVKQSTSTHFIKI